MTSVRELILGGARSGKSKLAESRASETGMEKVYIATATVGDAEMAAGISHRQQSRQQQGWPLIEEPISLANAIAEHQNSERCLLIDCPTLWISNCLHRECWPKQKQLLLEALPEFSGEKTMLCVST